MAAKVERTRMVRSPDDEVKLRSGSEQYKKNIAYLGDHYAELIKSHRNHWIGLLNSKVVISEDDPERLLKRLDKIRSKDVLVYYLADPEDLMIL